MLASLPAISAGVEDGARLAEQGDDLGRFGARKRLRPCSSMAWMDMFDKLLGHVVRLAAARAAGRRSGHALIVEAVEIGGRVVRVENLAVEEGLDAARWRSRNIGCGDAEIFGRLAPQILAVDLVDQALMSVSGANLPQRMFSARNQYRGS